MWLTAHSPGSSDSPISAKVRPLGMTTAQRLPILPDVPTIAEAGLPGYDTGVLWGFLAPAGLPAGIKGE